MAGETRYTPRLLLSLIETLPEGAAFPASYAGVPERRFWRSEHDLLAAVHNAVQVNTMISVNQKDRKNFHFIDPPWVAAQAARAAPADTRSGARKALDLLGGGFDVLPDNLRAKE